MSNNPIQQYNNRGNGGFDLTRLIVTLAVLYIANPIDIPGPFDDGGVVFFAMFVIGILGLFKSGGAQ